MPTSQLIAHSSRVRTPKRHNSESVLYMTEEQLNATAAATATSTAASASDSSKQSSPRERSSRSNNRLFPVNTYTESMPTHASTITTTASGQSDYQPNTPSK